MRAPALERASEAPGPARRPGRSLPLRRRGRGAARDRRRCLALGVPHGRRRGGGRPGRGDGADARTSCCPSTRRGACSGSTTTSRSAGRSCSSGAATPASRATTRARPEANRAREAEAALERIVREQSGPRASTAANLLGVLELVDASGGSSQNGGSVDRAIVELQNAVRLDPGDADAKANLELALGLAPPDSPFRSTRHGSSGRRRGGASETTPGRGY